MHYFTKLIVQFRSDLCWWHTFLTEWNGISLLRWDDDDWTPEYHVQTDASESWGCDAFWDGRWLQWRWAPEWTLSCAVWRRQLAGNRVLIECDNSSAVARVNKHYTKEQVAMHLL